MSKIIKKGSFYFLEQVVAGRKTSLYQYILEGGQYGSAEVRYTFEKADSTHIFMTNYAGLSTFRTELKLFYKEDTEVQKLIDTKFNARRDIQEDIREIVEAVNKL